jgi:hypothetical protein
MSVVPAAAASVPRPARLFSAAPEPVPSVAAAAAALRRPMTRSQTRL